MVNSNEAIRCMNDDDLIYYTREVVRRGCEAEADLLLHLAEIEERGLFRNRAFPSMFAFCVVELGFSEDAAYNRITVARAARRLPAIFEAVRSGQIHLSGLRVLLPHLTDENHEEVLAQAAGKSKRDIEELVARLAPKPPVPTVIRKLPDRVVQPALTLSAPAVPTPETHRPVIAPLSAETYKVQFTASRAFRDKLRQAQDLLRHRVPDGDPAAIFEKALDLLIERVKKERFGVGRKPRKTAAAVTGPAIRTTSR